MRVCAFALNNDKKIPGVRSRETVRKGRGSGPLGLSSATKYLAPLVSGRPGASEARGGVVNTSGECCNAHLTYSQRPPTTVERKIFARTEVAA